MRASRPRHSLERRFAVASAWLAAASLLVMALTAWAWAERLHRQSAHQIAERDLQWHAARAADALGHVAGRLHEVALSPLLQTALTDSAARVSYLQPYLESIREIDGIPVRFAIVDFEGKLIATHQRFELSPQARAWFLAELGTRDTRVGLGTSNGEARIWLSLGITYARSNTVEGQVWASLRLADLPQDDAHRLLPADAPVSAGDLETRLPLAAPLDALALKMVRPGEGLAVPRDYSLVLVFLSVAALLVLAAGVAARWVARSLTRDLDGLERFAGQVALAAEGDARAPEAGPHEVASLATSINRMLERLREQHQALESKSQGQLTLLATCIAHLGDAVLITSVAPEGEHPRYPIVFANPAFERMTGYAVAEVLGRSPSFLQGPDTDRAEVRRLDEALRNQSPVRVELLNYGKTGARYWVEMEIVPVRDEHGQTRHFVAIERDTTARRALEDQLRQSQKMEAIGTLAGGIAHDFNNVLAAILGNVSLSQDDLRQGRPVDRWLEQIGKSAERARALVQQILAYSRRRPKDHSPQELGGLVGETVAMLRATVPAGIRIVTQLPAEPIIVTGDPTCLEQVLLNLGTNAWQAMDGASGQIVYGLERSSGPEGTPCAHLWVQDDGCGIDEATLRRIFEPYFTTKPIGRGTGLGLAVVEGIVREHGGQLSVESHPGRGSTFHIRLPLTAAVPAERTAALPAATEEPRLEARVLYVDDDDVLVVMAVALMERWGCVVTGVGSAELALDTVRAHPRAFDVVISDVNMPGLSGVDLARALEGIREDLPVVLASGYVTDDLRASVRRGNVRALVRKERLQDDLAQVLRQVLASSSRSMHVVDGDTLS
ncbi:ATP-binding protein [Rubrivivax sp. RP6-9]|uniref:hybrid sensor histidine kinase/response regulator n=1 Tax=Rubrivivax sp. RP6-9 TaxID=3415750 RepID=UPI003CC64CC0